MPVMKQNIVNGSTIVSTSFMDNLANRHGILPDRKILIALLKATAQAGCNRCGCRAHTLLLRCLYRYTIISFLVCQVLFVQI